MTSRLVQLSRRFAPRALQRVPQLNPHLLDTDAFLNQREDEEEERDDSQSQLDVYNSKHGNNNNNQRHLHDERDNQYLSITAQARARQARQGIVRDYYRESVLGYSPTNNDTLQMVDRESFRNRRQEQRMLMQPRLGIPVEDGLWIECDQ